VYTVKRGGESGRNIPSHSRGEIENILTNQNRITGLSGDSFHSLQITRFNIYKDYFIGMKIM